jgi:hypothetical protein
MARAMGNSKMLVLNGDRQFADVTGGWNSTYTSAKMVDVRSPVTRCEVKVRGLINGGYAVDLHDSSQYTVNGLNTVFDIKVGLSGGAVAVRLPSGKTYADLVGTKIYVDGVLQT